MGYYKVCILYGNEIGSNSDNAAEIIKNKLQTLGHFKFCGYHFPSAVPYPCRSCNQCMADESYLTEEKCQYVHIMQDLMRNMKEADAVIVCASVFTLRDIDHITEFVSKFAGNLYYINELPEKMYKTAIIASIAPQEGVRPHSAKLAKTLRVLGAGKVIDRNITLNGSWTELSDEEKNRCRAELESAAEEFYKELTIHVSAGN